jgi:sugar lactone lactonase YvrE
MKRAGIAFGLLVISLALLPGAVAERTRSWRQSSYDDFEKGTAKGVALRSDGRLVLAPRFAQFSDPNAAQLLDVALDSKGNLYASAGTNAKVFRFDEKGAATAVFESQELAVQAIAFDARDNLYIATSPDGKVYRLTPRGERSDFFEPKTKYIWDLAVDSSGTVYVATGDKGEVFAVSPDGKSELFYRSEETHIRTLALDAKGNLLLGTEPNGLIVRVERGPAGGKTAARRAFVLYETDRKEVTALLVDASGQIYAASIGEKPRAPTIPTPPQPIVPQTVVSTAGPAGSVTTAVPVGQQQRFIPFPALAGGSGVYRLSPDGAPEELWSSREELVYSLGFSTDGGLLVGTGNKGLIVQVEGHNRLFTRIAKTAAEQVTGFASGPGGKVYAATANPGKVFSLGPDLEPEGTFESQTFDAKVFSQWGRLTWWGENDGSNGSIAFFVRTGNTSNPEKNWSEWVGPLTSPQEPAPACPPARFAQWKVVLKAPATAPTGRAAARASDASLNLSWVSLAYLPRNVAPRVESIMLQNPGIRVQGFPAPQQQQPFVQLRMPSSQPPQPGGVSFPQQQQPQQPGVPPSRFDPPPQGFAQRGYQSVIWSARDENDDELEYAIYFRGEGEKNWRLLKDKITQRFYTWESGTMPDGAYYLKVVASDAPANPPAEALTGERISDRFEIDNTPPALEGLAARVDNPEVKIRFTARDSYSALSRVEYSLNAGEWFLVFPIDRVTDSREETYEIVLRDLPPGEHTIAVRAFDAFENSSSAKASFQVEAPRRR